ncbi:putative Histidine kinase [uncultured delta proteobacterium]|uniref:histidine kinase n=1 Tax=uncultured delta proteobacterium TaxID=34034 RepID=A0A212KFM8_9DELT|nr:putative Histidine kinase [uncultured delta proteobacterium]
MADGNDRGEKRQCSAICKPARDKKQQEHRWSFSRQPRFSSAATWEWDIAAGFCHYPPEWYRMIGAEGAEPRNFQNWAWWSGQMHMDDMPGVLEVHRQIFEGKLEEAEVIYRLRRPDGRWIRLLNRGVVSQWKDDGTPAIMSGISIDISHLAMSPPLPENGVPQAAPRASVQGIFPPSAEIAPEPPEDLSRLNKRRLSALYQLAQMDKASEDEVLHFAMTSILQLTDSTRGFIFIPDPEGPKGKGLFFLSHDNYRHASDKQLAGDTLPPELVPLVDSSNPLATRHRIVNGDGITPVSVLFDKTAPVMRYIIAPGQEDGRTVCLAGVCNKASDYDESDLRQVETFVTNTWLIVRRRRHLLELQRAKETAEAASKAKDEFIANVSHELRTPLNGVLSMLQLLEDFPMTDQQKEFLHTACLSGNALVRIISDILDFSRIESGKMLLLKEPLDFKASVLSGLRLFREEAEKSGLSFTAEMDPAIPGLLQGDDTRIRQIVFNLVSNALKFTREGGITVTCSLEPEQPEGKTAIILTVTDTGIGIPKDKQSTLFNAFTQVDSFASKKTPGTGLGLSIVKRLVAMMDGDVRLESEPGKGTRVSCTIMLDNAAAGPGQTAEPDLPAGDQNRAPLHILVAEDDAVGRFALRSFLLRSGHRAVCVQNGRQALEALQIYPFDCLLTDIQMPDMDGLELARRIHETDFREFSPSEEVRALVREAFPEAPQITAPVDPAMPIVAVSAHTMAGDKERFLQQGINHYIAKPIALRELNAVLALVEKPNRNA